MGFFGECGLDVFRWAVGSFLLCGWGVWFLWVRVFLRCGGGAWCFGRCVCGSGWVLWGCGAGLVRFGWVEVVGREWCGAWLLGCVLNVCLVVGLWVIWGGVGSSVFLRARCRVECGGLGWVG